MTEKGASTLAELPAWTGDLLRARVAHLGLLDEDGAPRVQPITFAVHDGRLWSAIDAKPKRAGGARIARVRRLRRDPRAAVTVDRYAEEWERLAWVQVLGRIEILAASEAPDGLAALCAKYEAYRAQAPAGPLLALRSERCLCWRASA